MGYSFFELYCWLELEKGGGSERKEEEEGEGGEKEEGEGRRVEVTASCPASCKQSTSLKGL